MSAMEREATRIGAHRVDFEAPNVVAIELDGPFSAEEAAEFTARIRELGDRHGPLDICIGVSRFASSGPRVRQVLLENKGSANPIRAAVVWGASFPLRIAMTMFIKATSHITPGRAQFPFEFVATEEEAHAWLDAQRGGAESERKAKGELRPTGT